MLDLPLIQQSVFRETFSCIDNVDMNTRRSSLIQLSCLLEKDVDMYEGDLDII